MHAAVTFDTLEYMDELKRSGMKQEEAEAITKATAKAFSQMMETRELVTKSDLQEVKLELMKFISESTWKTIGLLSTIQIITIGLFTFLKHFLN